MATTRNPVVRYGALLRKGGAHTKSVSGQRHQSKQSLDDEIDEYFNERTRSEKQPESTEKGRNSTAPSSIYRLLISNPTLLACVTQ